MIKAVEEKEAPRSRISEDREDSIFRKESAFPGSKKVRDPYREKVEETAILSSVVAEN